MRSGWVVEEGIKDKHAVAFLPSVLSPLQKESPEKALPCDITNFQPGTTDILADIE
jgi:hypothetical protein